MLEDTNLSDLVQKEIFFYEEQPYFEEFKKSSQFFDFITVLTEEIQNI